MITKALAIFMTIVALAPAARAAAWEVAVVFLGADESAEVQADIDQNVLELAKTKPNQNFRLSLLREFPNRTASVTFEGGAGRSSRWDPLFQKVPLAGVQIPAQVFSRNNSTSILDDRNGIGSFFRQAFRIPGSRRILVIYGHGEGFRGLRDKSLIALQEILQTTLPSRGMVKPLDILWFDSCFMANVESMFQLRALSHLMVGSQESEFTAGMPFDAFSEFEDGPNDVRGVAVSMANRFLKSYSFLEKGSQMGAVASSSATISVVDTALLERALAPLKAVVESLRGKDLTRLVRANPRLKMEKPELVDLGRYLQTVANAIRDPIVMNALRPVLNIFEPSRTSRLQKSPRVLLRAPTPSADLLFGFSDWTRGFEGDESMAAAVGPLQATSFKLGQHSRKWPARTVNKRLYVQPFQPGIDVFNAVFAGADGKSLGNPIRVHRTRDFMSSVSSRAENPILFTGHTIGLGTASDRYTGLNIADPTMGMPSVNYVQTDFFTLTNWGN